MKKIIEFYGEGCPDCIVIAPAVEKLKKEEEIELKELEVWNNEENSKKMEGLKYLYDKECNGNFVVPSFYDAEGDRLLCEPRTYEELHSWVFLQ